MGGWSSGPSDQCCVTLTLPQLWLFIWKIGTNTLTLLSYSQGTHYLEMGMKSVFWSFVGEERDTSPEGELQVERHIRHQ